MNDLDSRVHLLLQAGGHTVATAESLTGGRLAVHFTDTPGASATYLGGVSLASAAFTVGAAPAQTTVAAALALDVDGVVDVDRRRSEAVAVLIARCMRAHGIAWEPWMEPPPAAPDPDLEPVAWAERWGFGVSTMVGRVTHASPPDPNLAMMAALPADDESRARAALYGTADGGGGCHGSANDAVYGLRDRLLASLRPALADLDARIAADPLAAQTVEAWRTCVRPIAEGDVPERRTFTERLITRFNAEAQRLVASGAAEPRLLALQADERRVAAALARCEAAFAGSRAAIAAPFETEFVARHRDELATVGAAIREAEAALPTLPP